MASDMDHSKSCLISGHQHPFVIDCLFTFVNSSRSIVCTRTIALLKRIDVIWESLIEVNPEQIILCENLVNVRW